MSEPTPPSPAPSDRPVVAMSGTLSIQGDGFMRRTIAKNTAVPIPEPVTMSATIVVNGETFTYQQQVPGLDWNVIECAPELRAGYERLVRQNLGQALADRLNPQIEVHRPKPTKCQTVG
ncbi:hypothetical protein [Streptomyces niveus]|uniref:hypothetical protein n=1 Tax=Streptomyces niveus TaxID=193462 RepID=UPI0034468BE9